MDDEARRIVQQLERDRALQEAMTGGLAHQLLMQQLERERALFGATTGVADPVFDVLARSGVISAMEAIQAPWVDEHNVARSLAGFAELHAMGQVLKRAEPFEAALSASLRDALGDWRTLRVLPSDLFNDPDKRVALYRSLGFNEALTAFSRPAFERILDVTELRVPVLPPAVPDLDDNWHDPEAHGQEGQSRNARAYRVLIQFDRKQDAGRLWPRLD